MLPDGVRKKGEDGLGQFGPAQLVLLPIDDLKKVCGCPIVMGKKL